MKNFARTFGAFVVAAAAIVSGSALAADLPPRPAPQMQVAAPVPFYNWTGIYVGINGGYAFGQQTPLSLFSDAFSGLNYSADGWLGGLTAGAQIQSGHTVLGLEGDIDWTNISGSGSGNVFFNGSLLGPATLSSDVKSISTLRTRIGYAADNWLFYLTGGLAITNESSTITKANFAVSGGGTCGDGNFNHPACNASSDLHLGFAAGAGVEYGITQNLSAKAEYLWVGAGAGNTLKENLLRAGLNWRFGM